MSRTSSIPVDLTTKLSVDAAEKELLAATRKLREPSLMAHRQMIGTVSPDQVVLRRGGVNPGARQYVEFQGRLVAGGGVARLQGNVVEVSEGEWMYAGAFFLVALLYHSNRWRTNDSPFDWLGLAVIALISVTIFYLARSLNAHWQRSNFSAAADLLLADIARALKAASDPAQEP